MRDNDHLEPHLPAIKGVHAALLTPRREGLSEVDLAAALDLVDFAYVAGCDGVVLCGSTGEFVHFNIGERIKLMRLAIKRSRLPVAVNVSHSSLDGALTLAREAAGAGASHILLMPPHFLPYSQAEVEEFFLRFARAAASPIPVLLYNIPICTSPINVETAVRLIGSGFFAGIKDSSGSLEDFRRMHMLKAQVPFALLTGDDRIFVKARQGGSDGTVSGVAGVLPELLVGLEKAIASGASMKRDGLEARLQEYIAWIARFPIPFGIRETAIARGLKPGSHATPPAPGTERLLCEFREWLLGWIPLIIKESRGD
jgi:dihydrodipicolinate synthase/N-acetylneuraminate lyase